MTAEKVRTIRYWDREKQCEQTEQVYGEAVMAWLYGDRLGQKLVDTCLSKGLFSKLYGAYQDTRWSRGKIGPFVRKFKIPMGDYEDRDFSTFNDFFSRRFREGLRAFERDPLKMPAFCEARYFGWERVHADLAFPVKGQWLTASAVLGDATLARPFEGGPLLLARLCPTDYHRFHFPDEGQVLESCRIAGRLHSVNPLALKYRAEILATNERQVSILETAHFGRLAYVEVGALCVGKIVQTYERNYGKKSSFKRGDEKGYFLFGGSTVIVFGEPGRWRPDADILTQTLQGRETYIKLGTALATSIGEAVVKKFDNC